MAGIPFLHNIDLNNHQLLNAKLHPSDSAPSNPGIGTIWYDTQNDLVKIYDNTATGNASGWNTITGDITGVNITAGAGLSGASVNTTAGAHTQTLTIGQGTGITVNSSDVAVTAAQTGITSVINAALVVGRDDHNQIDFSTDNEIKFKTNNETPVIIMKASGEIEATKFDGDLEGNADTATKIASITNSNIVQLTSTQTLTNKTLTAPTLTGTTVAATLDISGDIDVDGTTNLDNTDIDGTLAVDGTTISLDATTSLNIDNSNTSNGITIGTATSGVPISIGHATSETTINDNLTVTGDLKVSGSTVTQNVSTVTIKDPIIALGTADDGAAPGSDDNKDRGLAMHWHNGSAAKIAFLGFDDSTGDLTFIPDATISSEVVSGTQGTINANLDGNVTGDVTGNASTATQAVNLNNHDTDDLSEGSNNLYYTNARADARIDARSSAHTITGDNSETEFTISYGFTAAAINDVMIQVVDSYASSNHDGDTVYTEVERHSTTQCKIKFGTAPATGHTYRVLCFKIA